MSTPICDACGSRRVRRARTRSDWQRLVRRLTPLRRYACGDCGHRGWTGHHLEREAEEEASPPMPSRPMEARDFRLARKIRLRLVLTVLGALALGTLVAYLLSRRSAE